MDHRDRLFTQHELARALLIVGQDERGKDILKEIVRIESSARAMDDPDRLASQKLLMKAEACVFYP